MAKPKRVRSEQVSEYVGYWFADDGTIVDRVEGNVLRIYSNGTARLRKEDGSKDTPVVHQLIAKAFVENPNNCRFIKFKDGNSSNRAASNLEWIYGVRKVSDRTKEIINLYESGYSTTQVAELVLVTPQYVNRVLKDHRKRPHM